MNSRSISPPDAEDRLSAQVRNLVPTRSGGRDMSPESRDAGSREVDAAKLEATPMGPQGRGWQPHASTGKSSIWLRFSFLLVVLVPLFAVAGYALLIATPRYVSEFRAAVRTVEPVKSASLPELFGLGAPSQSTNDANAVVQYIHSRHAVELIERHLPLRATYTASDIDFVSRFYGKPDIEPITRYWNRMVEAFYESSTATIVVRASAYTPSDALKIAQYLLSDSESLVNHLSARARSDVLALAQGEVVNAEKQMRAVARQYLELQNKEATLDPQRAAEANIALASRLREQISQKKAELTMSKQLSPNTPRARVAEQNIAALEQELADVETRATGQTARNKELSEKSLSSMMGEFMPLAEERKFAEKAYLSALASLETARLEAARQQVYLSVIVPPGLPEEADFPRPWRMIGLTALVATTIWLIGLLGVYSIREHM